MEKKAKKNTTNEKKENTKKTTNNKMINNKPTNNRTKKYVSNKKIQETMTVDHNYNKVKDTLVYALGGLGEVGKNMYCFEHNDEIIIIDAGVMFPEDELLGVDYVIPDFSHLINNEDKVKALIITHGHEDHIGGMPFLLTSMKIDKIYAPRFAKALIERKLEDRRVKKANIIEINSDSIVKTKHFSIGFFNTIHSIPDSLGCLVNTPNGRVVHTGDFKFDLTPVGTNSDYQKMAYMGQTGITLLLSDSTNSAIEGFSISEKKVAQSIYDIIKKTPGRLLVSTFASNVHRLSQTIKAAVECDRKIVIFGRSMENVVTIGQKLKSIDVDSSHFISPDLVNKYPAEKLCIICTGSQGEPLAALSRIANGTHKYVKIIPGDTVVFSSSPIPGNGLSVSAIINQLIRVGANVLTNSPLNSLHTTGHASSDEQKLMLQLIKPKYFMPIHGEHKMLVLHRDSAVETGVPYENTFICANGDAVIIRKGTCFLSDMRIQTDDIYIDGNDTSGLSTAVIKDRHLLADNGMISVIVSIDSRTNKILHKPNIISRGFVYIKDNQSLLKEAEDLVYSMLLGKMKGKITFSDLKNSIKACLEPFLFQKTRRNPIVIPVILNHKDAMTKQNTKKNKKAES